MAILRTDITRALDELIENESGTELQALAVVLAKQKWPELIATERHKDGGLDAYVPASLADGRKGKGVAASLTAKPGDRGHSRSGRDEHEPGALCIRRRHGAGVTPRRCALFSGARRSRTRHNAGRVW
jgi:hypothetical protein